MSKNSLEAILRGRISTLQDLFEVLALPLEKEEIEALLADDGLEESAITPDECEFELGPSTWSRIQERISFHGGKEESEQLKIALAALRVSQKNVALVEEMAKMLMTRQHQIEDDPPIKETSSSLS